MQDGHCKVRATHNWFGLLIQNQSCLAVHFKIVAIKHNVFKLVAFQMNFVYSELLVYQYKLAK